MQRFDGLILMFGVEAAGSLWSNAICSSLSDTLAISPRPTRHRIDLDVRHSVNRVECDCHIPALWAVMFCVCIASAICTYHVR
jgi:hypothetical protein